MRIRRMLLKNWKNFQSAEVVLADRAFLVGPNASGKSNFLDALRFLRDVATPGGGLVRACLVRGGLSRIRCLAARSRPDIGLTVDVETKGDGTWTYELQFGRDPADSDLPLLTEEIVRCDGAVVMARPDADDKRDERRKSQTGMEQVSRNESFRPLVAALQEVDYLHLVPQIVRGSRDIVDRTLTLDAYGHEFLDSVRDANPNSRKARLARIQTVLAKAVPQLTELQFAEDRYGPHL